MYYGEYFPPQDNPADWNDDNPLEQHNTPVTSERRLNVIRQFAKDELSAVTLRAIVDFLVYNAHIAGSLSTKGVGLNLSKEERAEQYCKDKGLRT